jgi:hypothetical protein
MFAGTGCGKDRPIKVSGVVTLDGKPLPGAIVRFVPESGGGREATGTTDSEGSFQLSTYRTNDGALRGSYKITVEVQQGGPQQDPSQMGQGKSIKDAMDEHAKGLKEGKGSKPQVVVPAKYRDPSKTPLKETVPTEGKVTLELSSK